MKLTTLQTLKPYTKETVIDDGMFKVTDLMDEKSYLKEPPKQRRGEDALPYPMSRVRYDDRPRGMVRYAQGNSRKEK